MHTFAWPEIYYCLSEEEADAFANRPEQNLHLQLLFSKNPNKVLTTCQAYNKNIDSSGLADQKVLKVFEEFAEEKIKDKWEKNITLISLQGVHHPYGWIDSIENLEYPAKKDWRSGKNSNREE